MNQKTFIAVLMLVCAASSARPDAISDYAVGRKDANLKSTLSLHFRPVNKLDTEAQLFDALLSVYTGDDGCVTDIFTNEKVIPYYDFYDENNNVQLSRITDGSWMVFPEKYMLEAMHDLYNAAIVKFTAGATKGELPFGEVEEATRREGEMVSGYAMMGSEPIECVEPAAGNKGDIARMIFYAVTLYPMDLWGGWGGVVCRNNLYPTLSEYFAAIYMRWHREDPVDEEERMRNAAISKIQGNVNPFVEHPELAEYLWGDKKGEVYGTGGGGDDNPGGNPEVKVPLRGEYRMSDGYLDLYSPYVPDDVTWRIDGKACAGRVKLIDLGAGSHEITYENHEVKGKLKINIL